MKKTFTFLLCFLIPFAMLMAQKTWVEFTDASPEPPETQIIHQDLNRVILEISVPGMYVSEIEEEGTVYQRIELTEYHTTKDVGRPELPMIHQLIGIPGGKTASVTILEKETTLFEGMNIYPFQTPTTDNPGGGNKEFVIDDEFYKAGKPYPERQTFLDQAGFWRDVKVTGLHITPFKYQTSKKTLEAITRLKVEVVFSESEGTNPGSGIKTVSPLFYKMYESKIANFQSLGYNKGSKGNDDIKYLVITNTNPLNSIQPLVDWKNQQGFRVEVKTMQTGFSTPQEFKNYISQLYNSDGLEYVLMVGDAYPNGGNSGGPDDVPMYWWDPPGESGSYSDSWYTCLDGPDDHYADLAIGRFTYDNLNELDLQIQKTIDHYFNPDANTNWAENSILIAHQENYPGKYTQCCEEIRTYPYSLQTPIFEPAYGGAGYNNNMVINYVNANSCGIFNYRGHGSQTELWHWCPQGSFTATHVNQLTNANRLFVFFDVCCDNMDIVGYNGNCLCESFMKSPVASVAVNGAIIPSYTIPNHDYDKEMYKAVFDEGIYNIGYVTNWANVTVLNYHGTLGRSNVRTYLWLGDASLEPWTLQPANLTVNHDQQLFLGMSDFSVTVLGTGGALEDAMVCVSNDDQSIYGVAYTDATGTAQVVFDGPVQNPGTVTVTVTAHNHLPYQSDIPVIPQSGPYIVEESYALNDVTGGNGDGLMDYGESILLSLAVKNVGITPAYNVNVVISTTDPHITITDNSELYGTIDPDEVLQVADGFAFDVANDIPDGHIVVIDVEATGNSEEIWNSTITIEGHAPVLELGDVLVSDPTGNNNGKIDPGETVSLLITAENNGSSDAYSALGDLSSSDPYINIITTQMNYGDIQAGASAQQSFNIVANINTPAGHMADFLFDISADLGITASGTFTEVIGQIPILIVDLDDNTSSGPDMLTAIQNLGIGVEYKTFLPSDLNLYSSLFVCLGIYSNNHVLTNSEGQMLANYLNNGGMIYMEGGDTWYYDPQTPVHNMFGINATGDGSSDMGTILGQTGTFTEGMTFIYNGENNWMDRIEPSGQAVKILQNQSPSYGTGVAYDEGNYKTIGTSHEFGGLTDGQYPSTKEELMKQYLDFFGLLPPPIPPDPYLNLKVYLEGPWNGTEMLRFLNTYGYMPLTQPYSAAPWNYYGTESVASIPNIDIVDWVLIELRDAPGDASTATASTMVDRMAGFVLRDGTIACIDGITPIQVTTSIANNLYVVVWHRNHMGIMSDMPVVMNNGNYYYDFSTAASKVCGGVLCYKEIGPGVWGMVSGEGIPDGQINSVDKIDAWSPQSGSSGYQSGDFNMNGNVDNTDKIDFWSPNAGMGHQIPQ